MDRPKTTRIDLVLTLYPEKKNVIFLLWFFKIPNFFKKGQAFKLRSSSCEHPTMYKVLSGQPKPPCRMSVLRTVMSPYYLTLSLGTAFVGAYCAINLSEQFRLSTREKSKLLSRELLMLLMASSLGGVAIWCMHFVGMATISFADHGIEIRYRLDLTIISLIVAISFSLAGIQICSKDAAFKITRIDTMDEFIKKAAKMTITEMKMMKSANFIMVTALFQSTHRILIGGIIVAIGVCIMHYLGMAAIVTDARVEYDVGVVISSILLAIVASTAGVWILFRLLALYPHIEFLRLSSSAVIAIAVNGVHYTGMAAVKYVHTPGSMCRFNASPTLSSRDATFGALTGTIIFCFVMMLITIADLRAWYYVNAKVVRSTDDMMKDLQALENLDATSKQVIVKYRLIRERKGDEVLHGHSTCKISPNESALHRQIGLTDVAVQARTVDNRDADDKPLSTAAHRYSSNDATALERSV